MLKKTSAHSKRPQRILVTGATGYIGSHTCVELLNAGHDVFGIDDFSNSVPEVLGRIAELADSPMQFVKTDIRETAALRRIVADFEPTAIVHFAGLKAVSESVNFPERYWSVNVGGTLSVLDAIDASKSVRGFVFSSSCTVYGNPTQVPVTEDATIAPINPYGRTKFAAEMAIEDYLGTMGDCTTFLLRYFNPVGAHPSGRIGEDPTGVPNNLMPFATQVAVGRREKLSVFGNDYNTADGTCVRDYIHVVDLAKGHLKAVESLDDRHGCTVINLGTGNGFSVLEVISEVEHAVGAPIAHEIGDRRAGDAAVIFADSSLAEVVLGWRSELDLRAMCRDHLHWQQQNPNGYRADSDN